jgi:signal transduction histidine kinase
MKLVLRVTTAIFLFVTISSAMIGYFAISKYQSSQLSQVDNSLNSNIKELNGTKEDPLKVAQYLAQVSSIPLTVEYITESGLVTVLTVAGPSVTGVPSASLASQARHSAFNFGKDIRFRTFEMAEGKKLILAESVAVINSEVKSLTRQLIVFIILVDLLFGALAFLLFRRDGKLNAVSQLMEEQRGAMQRFLGDASHELRTPLTVVKGYVEMARNSTVDEKRNSYLEKSAIQIYRMESIIKDLLFLAEVGESSVEESSMVEIKEILEDQIEILAALQPLREVTSQLAEGVSIQADPKLLERAIANAFSNIRRHTPEIAPAGVTLRESNGEVVIVIEDGGPGLDEYPEKSRELKRFTAHRSAEGGGTGLGLSIISSVVDRHNGSLRLSKSELGGLRIEMKFPKNLA